MRYTEDIERIDMYLVMFVLTFIYWNITICLKCYLNLS